MDGCFRGIPAAEDDDHADDDCAADLRVGVDVDLAENGVDSSAGRWAYRNKRTN